MEKERVFYIGNGESPYGGQTVRVDENSFLSNMTDPTFLKQFKFGLNIMEPHLIKKLNHVQLKHMTSIVSADNVSHYGFYYVNGSIPSWCVMLAMRYFNEPFAGTRVKVMRTPKDTERPEFLKLNPNGKTPVVICPTSDIMTESLEILKMIDQNNSYQLFTADNKDNLELVSSVNKFIERAYELRKIYKPFEALLNKDNPYDIDELNESYEKLKAEYRDINDNCINGIDFRTKYGIFNTIFSVFTAADCVFYSVLAYHVHRGFPIDDYRYKKFDIP